MFGSKKTDPFFFTLYKIAENMYKAVHYVNDYKMASIVDFKKMTMKMKEYEVTGDKLIYELIIKLNTSFMTPIEREDILALAKNIDEVLNGMEGCIAHFEMFSFLEMDPFIRDFLRYITQSTDEILRAMKLLMKKDLIGMHQHAILIKEYERQCDEIQRKSIKQLFLYEKNPIRLIKRKDLYEKFEEIADSCKSVANTIEIIIIRNA